MNTIGPGRPETSLLNEVLPRLKIVRGPDARGEYVSWCPFHPDGEGKPPHQPNLQVSERGYICHACSAKGGLKGLAEKLGVNISTKNLPGEIAYDYRSEDCQLLYQVVRLPGKKFFQRRPDGSGGWIKNLKGVGRILYHLPWLRQRQDEPVYIVEGEKDADLLHSIGLLATTNSGGAGKWDDNYSASLAGREIVILPDNDDPGRAHAEMIARSTWGKAKSIKVVALPGLDPKGDVSDYLASGRTVEDLLEIVRQTPEWSPTTDDVAGEDVKGDAREDAPEGKKSLGTLIAEMVDAEGILLFHDERMQTYARLDTGNGNRIVPIASHEFDTYLGRLAWERLGKAAGGDAIRAAKNVLEGQAHFEGPCHPLHCRITKHSNEIMIDHDGVRAIRVRSGSWEMVKEPPVLFRPNPHIRPLPDPVVTGGNVWEILKFTRIEDPQVALLLVCYLVIALYPEIPVPPLIVHGVQGAAKSTLLKMVKRLIDRHEIELRGLPSDVNEYTLVAWHNRCVAFDNLTSIPPWLSDAMCRTVTGDGLEKRMLYTDNTSMVYRFQRVLLLAGINLVAQNPDLLDRAIIVELAPIPPAGRRPESELWSKFDAAAPIIFGGMLDVLAKAMEILPSVQLEQYPRMADFAKVGVAVAIALGRTPEEFLAAYESNIGRQSDASMESSVVAQAVLEHIERRDGRDWCGAPGELLGELERIAEDIHINTRAPSWPKSPNILSRRLKELEPPLRARGIEVELGGRSSSKRRVTIRRVTVEAVPPTSGSPDPVTAMTIGDDGLKSIVMLQQLVFPDEIIERDDRDDIAVLLHGIEELPMNPNDWPPDVKRCWQSIAGKLCGDGEGQMMSNHHAKLAIQNLWKQTHGLTENSK